MPILDASCHFLPKDMPNYGAGKKNEWREIVSMARGTGLEKR